MHINILATTDTSLHLQKSYLHLIIIETLLLDPPILI